jgi:hypothetical protein
MKTILLFLLLLTSLRAATLTYTGNIPTTFNVSDNTNTITVPKFNVSGATLTAVTVEVQGYMTNRLSAENKSGLANIITVSNASSITVQAPALPTIVGTLENYDSVGLLRFDGVIDYAGNSGFSIGADAEIEDEENVTNLSGWVGSGTANVNVIYKSQSTYAGPAAASFLTETSASACITVTYTYDEPCRPLKPRHKKHWRFRRDR